MFAMFRDLASGNLIAQDPIPVRLVRPEIRRGRFVGTFVAYDGMSCETIPPNILVTVAATSSQFLCGRDSSPEAEQRNPSLD